MKLLTQKPTWLIVGPYLVNGLWGLPVSDSHFGMDDHIRLDNPDKVMVLWTGCVMQQMEHIPKTEEAQQRPHYESNRVSAWIGGWDDLSSKGMVTCFHRGIAV